MKFFRNQEVEQRAEYRIVQLENLLGRPVEPPISLDLIAEQFLDLNILWEIIDELPGEVIYGGLRMDDKLIILNESRRTLFERKPGLERSTKGHEMGHWDLYGPDVDPGQGRLFQTDQRFALRSGLSGNVRVLNALIESEAGRKILEQINRRADDPDEKRVVNRYAAALSMPRKLINEAALSVNRSSWPALYGLAELFEVNISALTVRLQQLNLLHIDKDGRPHSSAEKANGQQLLF